MSRLIFFVALVGLSGCAASPDSIAPAYVSELVYDSYNCDQLAQEEAKLHNALGVVSQEQRNARSGDTWSVALLGLPVSSFSGKNVAAQVAQVKGNLQAVQEAEIKKTCTIVKQEKPKTAS